MESVKEQDELKKSLANICDKIQQIRSEPDSVVTTDYLNALSQLHDGALSGLWGKLNQSVATVVIESNKLIAENILLRRRLQDAVSQLVTQNLKSGLVSMARYR